MVLGTVTGRCLRARPAAIAAAIAILLSCATVSAAESDGRKVVASRGAASLTFDVIDARIEEIPPDKRIGFMDSPERIESTLSQLLLIEQLAQEALAQKLDQDPRLERQLDLMRKRMLGNLRLEQLREQAAAKVDAKALARERFLADSTKFAVPESRTARHVLFSTSKRSDAEAQQAAAAAVARIATGESLEAIARESTDDVASKAEGGLLRDIVPGRTDPAFDAALFALAKPGATTPAPVKSQFGYHLIELVSINPGRKRSFEEVQDQLVAEVQAAAVERLVKGHTDQLLSLPLTADEEAVASLRTRYGSPQPLPADAPSRAPEQAGSSN
jgi:parvulin-like peptidyl-prolyl isomerase